MYADRNSDGQLGFLQAIPVAVSAVQSVERLFSGGPSLADRVKQRIAWTVQMAQAGSVLAAAIVLGGAHEQTVNASERQAWADVVSAVPPNTLQLAQARYPGGYWPVGQSDFYSDTTGATHQQITREVNSAAAANDADGTNVYAPTVTRPVQGLPPSQTVAAFNWTPYLIAGGALALMTLFGQPSRRR